MDAAHGPHPMGPAPSLGVILREWGRIGCLGFGGPPVHIRMLRDLCVNRHGWLDAHEFEDAVATCNLLPGPSSTQLAILCAWRARGAAGAWVGGLAFIVPGFLVIVALAVLFLSGSPPRWALAAGAGAGAAIAAVAIHAAVDLIPSSWDRCRSAGNATWVRWVVYVTAGALAAATVGPYLVLVILGGGLLEMALSAPWLLGRTRTVAPVPALVIAIGGVASVWTSLAWVAIKVGALSYGGGFVIVPLMQADAVDRYHWMTGPQFLNAVALGQITPGPLVQTIAVVGYAAAGLAGAVFATAIAFSPSFLFILAGARHFDRLRTNPRVKAFLMGAGPAAIGAILGSALPLARALSQPWQFAVLAGAFVVLFAFKRSTIITLLFAAATGVALVAFGAPLPG